MIKLLGAVPNEVTVACSGGPDSMAAVDFFRAGRKNVAIAHFDHGTEHGIHARDFVETYAAEAKLDIVVGEIRGEKPTGKSWEDWWRDQRYEFFRGLPGRLVTAHHLDDVAEWWVFSSLHGTSRLIPHSNGAVIRPFLSTPKARLVEWCDRHDVPYVIDPTNQAGPNMRALLRNSIMPNVYTINPGLHRVLIRKLQENYGQE